MRFVVIAVMIANATGCSPPTPVEVNDPAALERLQADGRALVQATRERDHEKLADLTHPALIDKAGGRDAFIRMVEKVETDYDRQGFKLLDGTLSPPSRLVECGRQWYAILPYTLSLSGPEGACGVQPASLVGSRPELALRGRCRIRGPAGQVERAVS